MWKNSFANGKIFQRTVQYINIREISFYTRSHLINTVYHLKVYSWFPIALNLISWQRRKIYLDARQHDRIPRDEAAIAEIGVIQLALITGFFLISGLAWNIAHIIFRTVLPLPAPPPYLSHPRHTREKERVRGEESRISRYRIYQRNAFPQDDFLYERLPCPLRMRDAIAIHCFRSLNYAAIASGRF